LPTYNAAIRPEERTLAAIAMSEPYKFNHTDENILLAVGLLLRKVAAFGIIRPAQLVTVAKLLHVLLVRPRITFGVTASISIDARFGPEGKKTWYGWKFTVELGELSLWCGGGDYDHVIGSAFYTTMTWSACPGQDSDYDGCWDERWMVPDLTYNADADIDIDFASGDYTIGITDGDNPLLNGDEEEDTEEGPDSQNVDLTWSMTLVNDAERRLAEFVDRALVGAKEPAFAGEVTICSGCNCPLDQRGLFLVGSILPTEEWKKLCAECYESLREPPEGMGWWGWWGGRMFARQANGDWRMVAGW
jgi:hypothetical protein